MQRWKHFFQARHADQVVWHIPHRFSEESAKKSEIINLGVVKADPSSAKGVVTILCSLNDHVPVVQGEPHTILTHGDQLSCERMADARRAMGDHEVPADTLKGLEPTPGEFHHRCLLLQVSDFT